MECLFTARPQAPPGSVLTLQTPVATSCLRFCQMHIEDAPSREMTSQSQMAIRNSNDRDAVVAHECISKCQTRHVCSCILLFGYKTKIKSFFFLSSCLLYISHSSFNEPFWDVNTQNDHQTLTPYFFTT